MEYYTDDISAIPYRQLRDIFIANEMPRPVAALIAGTMRLQRMLGFKSKPMFAFTDSEDEQVDKSEIPAEAAAKWAPILEQLDDLGFRILAYCKPHLIGPAERNKTYLLSSDGRTLVLLLWSKSLGLETGGRCSLEFNTFTTADPEFLTMRVHKSELPLRILFDLDFVAMESHSDRLSVEKVYHKHQARIENKPAITLSPDMAESQQIKSGRRRMDWVLQQRLVRRLNEKEVHALRDTSQMAAHR